MKKIFAIFGLWGLSCGVAYANCDWVEWDPRHDPYDNEYIWKTARDYNDVIKGVKDGPSLAAVCGARASKGMCTGGETINAPADHAFEGNAIRQAKTYKCTKDGTFGLRWKWVPVEEANGGDTCPEFKFEGATVKPALKKGEKFPSVVGGNTTMTREECQKITGETLSVVGSYQVVCGNDLKLRCELVKSDKDPSGDFCAVSIKGESVTLKLGEEYPVDLTVKECEASVKSAHGDAQRDAHGVYHVFCGPICKFVGCEKGYTPTKDNKCVKKNSNPTKQKSCREQHKKDGANRLACCDVEVSETGFWKNGACYCNNEGYDFKVVNGDHGQCVQRDEKAKCSDPKNMDKDCKCKAQYTHTDENGKCVCNEPAQLVGGKCSCNHIPGSRFEAGYCKCDNKDKELIDGKCEWSDEYMKRLRADIESKYSKIESLIAGFEVNKWKSAEGEFNTARLASDSIAGVVLGTVGGVVTARLVKKAQVKQGFEDLQCHIGGHPVADYGDEMVVGLWQ